MARNLHNVPLHDSYEKHPTNPHGYVAEQSKIRVFCSELSNSGGWDTVDVEERAVIVGLAEALRTCCGLGGGLHGRYLAVVGIYGGSSNPP